jgi:hypothetical protein
MACLEPMLPRRQVLAASMTTLPLFLALSACAGPDPLKGPPPVASDVRTLMSAILAEDNLVYLYTKTIDAHSGLSGELSPLLAEHHAHLSELQARIVVPPGRHLRVHPTARPPIPATTRAALAQIVAAERAAITAQLKRLPAAPAAQAQLYASIAACEATHITFLNGQTIS